MKPGFVPSYLFLSRHGIYYFRWRIPLSAIKKYNLSRTEIKKSPHTSNRIDAIKKARCLWVEDIDTQFQYPEKQVTSGIPKDKYVLILSIPKALHGIRENIGKHDVEFQVSDHRQSRWSLTVIVKISLRKCTSFRISTNDYG
jgi:hypothetical protein